jgi:hypothetical protein
VFLSLEDGGKENVLVYVTGQTWCGSGGCTLLVLQQHSGSYTIVTRVRIAKLPIILFPEKTNGWHDVGVFVQGGGVQSGYEAELEYDGKSYPTNPSVPPARRSALKNQGKVVVPVNSQGTFLYE